MKHSIACIVFVNNKVLIGKRINKGQMGGRWEFPGGKVEEGEDAIAAIKREFLEEFSVPVRVGSCIAEAYFEHNGEKVQLQGYEVFLDTDNPQWVLTEHTEIDWVDINHIPRESFVDSDLLIYPQVLEYLKGKQS